MDLTGPADRNAMLEPSVSRASGARGLGATQARLDELIAMGDLLLLHDGAIPKLPAFQFGDDFSPLPGLWVVQATLNPNGDPAVDWDVARWLVSPRDTFNGNRAVDLMRGGDLMTVFAEACSAVSTLSRALTDAGVEHTLRRVRLRTREFERNLTVEFRTLSESEVHELLGTVGGSTLPALCWVSGEDGERVYPAFQFVETRVRPEITELLRLGATYNRDGRDVAFWLANTSASLAGGRPVDHLSDGDAVLKLAERVWAPW